MHNLNLKKIPKFLNKLKFAKNPKVTPELIDRALNQRDSGAMNELAQEVIKLFHGAMKSLGIMNSVPYSEWTDFRDKELEHFITYSLPNYDPTKSAFPTFVFNHVRNMWITWAKAMRKKHEREVSLDRPIGEEGSTISDIVEDSHAPDFVEEVEAQSMVDEISKKLHNPKYERIFKLWLDKNPTKQSDIQEIADEINKEFPDSPISGHRVYRVIRDIIRPLFLSLYPESKKETPAPTPAPAPAPIPKVEESPSMLDIEEEYPRSEEYQSSPAYRIDPQTGEKVKISLSLLKMRKVTATQAMWFDTAMFWLHTTLYGKYR